ncbi:MAG: hypothetical protein CMB70_02295 [Euryarchaeota archaeon]|nr:hypothetical protein [Euryarchaeota archaeon]|tara:strand:- start:603 stop:1205 length:603 start_codon:yes stop_codon:yes gene_type:complete
MQSYQHQKDANGWPNQVLVEARSQIDAISNYIDNVLEELTSFMHTFNDGIDSGMLHNLLDQHLPDGPIADEKKILIDDILRLATLFEATTKSGKIKIQFEIVTTDMCRLFHADYYRQRLLCTYLGPGTEWLDHSNVNRHALGKGSNNNIVKDEAAINRANTFDVLILKGQNYGEGELAVVHRSPPIMRYNKMRILLKIDE